MRKIWILVGLWSLFLLPACGGIDETVAPKAEAITCTVAYRADITGPIEQEETIRFTDSDDEQSVAFADMMFHAAYSTGATDNERVLRVWVTDGDDMDIYHSHLYQLSPDSGPQNQFVGGHGFTGLNYSYAPDSSAELQFWCEAG